MTFESPLHRAVYVVLLTGLVLSITLILAGAAVSLIATGALPETTLPPVQALRAALSGDGQGLVTVGLLGLVATPLAVVITAIVVSAARRDTTGVLAGIGIALVMILSFILSER